MRISFRMSRERGKGKRGKGIARWRFAGLALVLLLGSVGASEKRPRVISMAPHLTELAFAAGGGDRLVGVVDWSDYPAEAAALPLIGDAFRFDLERIMGLDPDLALAWRGGTPQAVTEQLDQLGIDVLWIETQTLEQIAVALETIGDALGESQAGREAARQFRSALDDVSQPDNVDQTPTRVFYQVSARPLYTLGGRHVINEVFRRCNMTNVFDSLDIEAAVVDREAVLAAAPDMIIAGAGSDQDDPLEDWRNSTLFEQKRTALHTVDPDLLIRPTPRILQGINHLCTLNPEH